MTENNFLPDHLDLWQKTTNWQPSPEQQKLWQELYSEILEINQYLNLTRITTPEEFWEKNLWDSLAPIIDYDLTDKKIIDVGTGAGFPGLLIALTFPQSQVVLMDSTSKKINFLNSFIAKLQLKNVTTLINRAEVIGKHLNHREKYDFVTIRAVAQIPVCLEYSLPLLKQGGISILYRGNLSPEEKDSMEKIANKLGGKVIKITNQNTPINDNIRHCIYIQKIRPTPNQYPRSIGTPNKNPLT